MVGGCGRCLSSGALGLLLALGCLSFFVLAVLPPLFCFFLLAAAVDLCPLMLVAAVGVFSFGALWLLPALGCLSFGGCVWCLLFGALGFLGLLPPWAVSVRFRCCDWRWFFGALVFFVFFPWVVVLVFVFWRYGASACFAAFLFLLVAAVGMGPSHSAACADVWCCVLRFGVCPPWGLGRFVSFAAMRCSS